MGGGGDLAEEPRDPPAILESTPGSRTTQATFAGVAKGPLLIHTTYYIHVGLNLLPFLQIKGNFAHPLV